MVCRIDLNQNDLIEYSEWCQLINQIPFTELQPDGTQVILRGGIDRLQSESEAPSGRPWVWGRGGDVPAPPPNARDIHE